MSDKKKMGRPPVDNARTERMHIRVTLEEKQQIKELAEKKGITVTQLILDGIKLMK